MPTSKPSIFSVLSDLAHIVTEPISLAELTAAVHARRDVAGSAPSRQSVERIKSTYHNAHWVLLSSGTYIPLRMVLSGLSFRIIPDAAAIKGDYLLLDWFTPYSAKVPTIYHGQQQLARNDQTNAYPLHGWMHANGVKIGDHVIVTIDPHALNTFSLRVERAEDVHLEASQTAEYAILSALKKIPKAEFSLARATAAYFTTVALAPWRTGYPWKPWQQLYDLALQDSRFADAVGKDIKRDIAALQQSMRLRRAADVERGIWDGMAQRFSAVRLAIDTSDDESMSSRVNVPAVDMRLDFSSRIDESHSQGLYDVSMGQDEGDDDPADHPYSAVDQSDDSYTSALHSEYDDDDGEDSLFDAEEINGEELDDDTFAMLFANRHPALEAWSSSLLRSMRPLERRLMVRAESDEDYNAVLTVALQRLLPTSPSFMQTLRPTTELPSLDPTDGGQSYAAFQIAEFAAAQAVESPEDISTLNDDDVFATGGEALFAVETALRESESFLRRYGARLETENLSKETIRRKLQFVRGFAQFMARYYTRALDSMNYAILDEYVFFYYPRHANAIAPRNARSLLSALRDFYKSEAPRLLLVAQALYEAHTRAEEVLRLLVRAHQYPHEMTALVVHLFAPYTA